jgi:hypothetical protein
VCEVKKKPISLDCLLSKGPFRPRNPPVFSKSRRTKKSQRFQARYNPPLIFPFRVILDEHAQILRQKSYAPRARLTTGASPQEHFQIRQVLSLLPVMMVSPS